MLGRDPADIGQRAIDAGLLLVIGDGAPIPENCGARDWAKAHYNGEDAHAITKPDSLMVVDGALAREPAKPFVSCLSPEGRARAKAHNRFMRGIDR